MPADRVVSGSARASFFRQPTWQNYHQNFEQEIQGIYLLSNGPGGDALALYREAADLAQKLIAGARGRHAMHSLGSGWSFSPVAVSNDVLLNDKDQRVFVEFDRPTALHQDRREHHRRFLLCQAGMSIKAINKVLDERRLALPTSGASNGQTIAGALSTGTHGGAIDFGAVPEMVVALHVATAPDKTVWLERKSYPLANESVAKRVGAERIRDDALFDAALVGLGAFGILLGVVVEALPRYLLEVHVGRVPRDAALSRAMDGYDFEGLACGYPDQRPYHFGVVVDPHAPAHAMVTLMYKRRYKASYPRHDFIDPTASLGDDALTLLSRVLDAIPLVGDVAVPKLVSKILGERYQEVTGALGTHAEVFDATTTPGKIASAAIGLPAARASAALRLVLEVHRQKGPYPGAIGLRFVKGTRATLGFTRFDDTCVLELDGVDGKIARKFHREVWKALEQEGVEHTVHWGKLNELTPARVRAMYGDERVDAWLAARRELLTPAVRRVFDNDFLRSAGLADS